MRARVALWVGLLCGVGACLPSRAVAQDGGAPPTVDAGAAAAKAQPTSSPAPSAESASPATPLRVFLGLFVNDYAHIDLKNHNFFADFYIWFRAKPRPGETWNPSSIEFMNGRKVDMVKVDEKKLPDGYSYWEYRAKGIFRGRFDLAHYPLDHQPLRIIIEDSQNWSKKLELVPDPTHHAERMRWIDDLIQIPDWTVERAQTLTATHDYRTNFGDTTPGLSLDLAKFSRFTFVATIERRSGTHLVKFLIPLLVISGLAFLTFFIKTADFGVTSRLCGTALLSSIALHITSSRNLPEVGYLLISDKIFILFYLAIFITLVEKVAVNRFNAANRSDSAVRLERAFRFAFPTFLAIGSVVIFLTR